MLFFFSLVELSFHNIYKKTSLLIIDKWIYQINPHIFLRWEIMQALFKYNFEFESGGDSDVIQQSS